MRDGGVGDMWRELKRVRDVRGDVGGDNCTRRKGRVIWKAGYGRRMR